MQIAPWVFPLTEETASVPPHVRGKDTRRQRDDSVRGITPACAGKRYALDWMDEAMQGSPPRVRGKVPRCMAEGQRRGITPACAGKRSRGRHPPSPCPDHPRVCREKRFCDERRKALAGSPPRVRGKGLRAAAEHRRKGITPACAGKRACPWGWTCRAEDHPRVCGEKLFLALWRLFRPGSPPRVRGKVLHVRHDQRKDGITPACAGKRAWPSAI